MAGPETTVKVPIDIKALSAPFNPTEVYWRIGSMNGDKTKGMALAYIDARNVMERLDEVCGPGNWQCRYPFMGCCEVGIKIEGEWVWKSNGAGQSDIEGEKGQFSDSFKRAAVLWGIGRYLYELPSPWVRVENKRIPEEVEHELMDRLAKWQAKRFGETK